MRRFLALIAIPLLACVVLAGCGSSKSSASSSSSSSSSTSNSSVTATGSFGKTPTVNIPKAKAGANLAVKTLIQGTGTTLTKSDAMAANFVLYFWDGTSSALKANTFTSNPTVIGEATVPVSTKEFPGISRVFKWFEDWPLQPGTEVNCALGKVVEGKADTKPTTIISADHERQKLHEDYSRGSIQSKGRPAFISPSLPRDHGGGHLDVSVRFDWQKRFGAPHLRSAAVQSKLH